MSPETEAAFQRMSETVNGLAGAVQQSIAAQQTSIAHLTVSVQQSIADGHHQSARVSHALEELAEQQIQLAMRIDSLAQQSGDIQALVRSNREILAEMRRDREGGE